jgi:hypothetical protein
MRYGDTKIHRVEVIDIFVSGRRPDIRHLPTSNSTRQNGVEVHLRDCAFPRAVSSSPGSSGKSTDKRLKTFGFRSVRGAVYQTPRRSLPACDLRTPNVWRREHSGSYAPSVRTRTVEGLAGTATFTSTFP